VKARSKRVCYNCGKNGNFIAQCPYKRKDEDDDKKKKKEKGYVGVFCIGKKQGGQDCAFQLRGGIANYRAHCDLS
jgi:hypothetical protein